MDTKTPPIPQKQYNQYQNQQQHLERINYKTTGGPGGGGGSGRQIQVSLPPLSPPPNRRQRLKAPGSPWARRSGITGTTTPGIFGANGPIGHTNNHQTERPYRVLHLGATPLMHACQQADRTRVLRLLRDQRETIGYRDRTLRSALHYCMDAGAGGAVATAAPELVNAPDAEGHTPLHLAVIAGDSQLVAVLLANGANVNAKDLEGHSVLHWATVCGEVECVRLVLAAGGRPSTPDMRGGSPLHYAAQCCGAASPTELSVPKKVGLKVLQSLLDYGANHNAKDEDGRQPILWAASAGSVEAVLALARAGGSAAAGASDKDGLTALHCAASRGHAGCVEALVNLCGSQPDHVDDNGCSALHYAATLGHADATALLLRLGADPNRQDRKGRTPALCAAAKGQLETLKLLAQHGGSLYARTVRGSGIAHESAASGRVELIKWLAKKRPGILDTATHDGRTPLHVAALHGHVDACKVLLDNGARVNAVLRTTKGSQMTALDAALYRGHRDCAKLIQMHGGVTAQHVRSRKGLSHKEFAAKLRLKRRETSSESDSETPRRRRRRRRSSRSGPEHFYYEEKWEERKSSRRRRSDNEESRSYSDQDEPRRKNRGQRRARSESARYEDPRSEEELRKRSKRSLKKKKKKKQISKARKHDYNESSTESESYEEEKSTIERENYGEEVSDNISVSDDSLEVVIVKKSVERTSERVEMAEKKPRGDKGSVVTSKKLKTRKRTVKKKSKERISEAVINSGEKSAPENSPGGPKSTKKSSKSEKNYAEEEFLSSKDPKIHYQMETADSTSQEAVERVTVTAMVHKDQLSDTPKTASTESSSGNGAKNEKKNEKIQVEEEVHDVQKKKTRPRSARPGSSRSRINSARTRMDHILEKADEMQNALVQKAADLKKGIDEMREHISGEKSQSDESVGAYKIVDDRDLETEKHPDDESDDVVIQKEENLPQNIEAGSDNDKERQKGIEQLETEVQDQGAAALNENLKKSEEEKEKKRPEVPMSNPEDETNEAEDLEARSHDVSKTSLLGESSSEIQSPSACSPEKQESSKSKSVGASDIEDNVVVEGRSSSRKSSQSRSSNCKSRPGSTAKDKSTADQIERKTLRSASRSSKSKSVNSPGKVSNKSVEDVSGESLELDDKKLDVERIETKDSDFEVHKAELSKEEDEDFEERDFGELPSSKTEEEEPSRKASRNSEQQSDRSRSQSRPSTAKQRRGTSSSTPISPIKKRGSQRGVNSSEESSPSRTTAIVAVIESPEWPEEDENDEEQEEGEEEEEEEAIDNEIRDAIGDYPEPDTDIDENSVGVMRVLPSTSDEETPRTVGFSRTSAGDLLPQVAPRPRPRMLGVFQSPGEDDGRKKRERHITRNRRDSGGRDSGIEPSPRISKIPKRTTRYYPNTEKQQALHMETVTRDVQISLRRYHLERKIFFQLMELKRLQIRHGRANEQVLVKRQVEAFHKAGTSGPTLGVSKYDQPLTFRHFEAFLYEQLRRLQRRPATPDWCTGAKQCTQKTHRCHHATSAYTSFPVYTYLGVGDNRSGGGNLLPNIEGRGKGQMTVEVTHGEDKQVIALPAEKLDRSKRYFVTFTVRGESQSRDKTTNDKNSHQQFGTGSQRNAKSV